MSAPDLGDSAAGVALYQFQWRLLFSLFAPGRPCAFSEHDESVTADAVRHFADSTSLALEGVADLVHDHNAKLST